MSEVLFYKKATQKLVFKDIRINRRPGTSIIILDEQSNELVFSDSDDGHQIHVDVDEFRDMVDRQSLDKQIGFSEYVIKKEGGKIAGTIVAIGKYSNWNWIIAIYIDEKQILKYTFESMMFSIFFTILFLIFIFYSIYRLSNKVTQAVEALENGANYFSRNVFDKEIYIKGNNEFSRLAKSFNIMARKINNHQNRLEYLAHYDDLTGLPNRSLLSIFLKKSMEQEQRRMQSLAVVYIDLDGFKSVNDQYGHQAGDHLLVCLAKQMKKVLRKGDMLSRIGGDEFIAVLIDLEGKRSLQLTLNRLLDAATSFVEIGTNNLLQISASLGVVLYPQKQSIDAEQLMRQADQAMYQAKLSGKNRYAFFDIDRDYSTRTRNENVDRIRLALEQKEFLLHYQPKVNMRTGEVLGAEALIRWQHPERGMLQPDNFLHLIEGHDISIDLGEWVINTALLQLEQWFSYGHTLSISVNVGAMQIQAPNFISRVSQLLAMHPKILPSNLELEILETSALRDISRISKVINECKKLGITFSLDDFGTGYSSLTYLRRLKVANIKIDHSFVHNIIEDSSDRAIFEGIVKLATTFNRHVIAEGVESVAHGAFILKLGCELAQGFGIAKPMPGDRFLPWLGSWKPDSSWIESGSVAPDSYGQNISISTRNHSAIT